MKKLFYNSVKVYSRMALSFFFGKWQVAGKENIPDSPVIFVANHQNAFLDAVLVACSTRHNLWFAARADVFKNPVLARLLYLFQMLPVFRFRDGFGSLKNNENAINAFADKINRGDSILVFAEGNHGNRYQLRPLQKGFTRVAYAARYHVNAAIVPVGIQYEGTKGFGTRVLVNFGKATFINTVKDQTQSEMAFEKALLESTADSLQKLI